MSMLRLDVDARELLRAPREISKAWVRAGNRAVTKTSKWAATQGLRAIAQAERIPVGKLRQGRRSAVRVRRQQGANQGTVWFGVLPVKAGRLGKPRQTKKGARVGRHFFGEAFVATMRNGHVGIWLRSTKARLPIVEQFVVLDNAESALQRVQERIPDRLTTVMAQELNYEGLRSGGAR